MHKERHLERRETLAFWPAKDAETGEAVGLVRDLSVEGVQMHSEHDFVVGHTFTIRIAVDGTLAGTDKISLLVEVIWCSRSGVPGLYHAGLKIIDISDEARRNITALVQAFSYPVPSQEDGTEQGT